MPWTVCGILTAPPPGSCRSTTTAGRSMAARPTDQSVIEAIRAIGDAGKAVTFYPVHPDDPDGGQRAWSTPGPARPRTSRCCPGAGGSPRRLRRALPARRTAPRRPRRPRSQTSSAPHSRADFALNGETVVYSGPAEFSYRRFVLHYAMALQGGGRGRGVPDRVGDCAASPRSAARATAFRSWMQLVQLAADVRSILGAGT